ncbi:hypothetical protein C8J56DRAFT_970647 [Mycena floridula]|nr:hypothetical protein C8J56DRAFT_970647 [Mycena floridula]
MVLSQVKEKRNKGDIPEGENKTSFLPLTKTASHSLHEEATEGERGHGVHASKRTRFRYFSENKGRRALYSITTMTEMAGLEHGLSEVNSLPNEISNGRKGARRRTRGLADSTFFLSPRPHLVSQETSNDGARMTLDSHSFGRKPVYENGELIGRVMSSSAKDSVELESKVILEEDSWLVYGPYPPSKSHPRPQDSGNAWVFNA